MTREEIDEYICKCPYFSGAKCIDRSILGTHIGSCSLEFHHKKICPSSECICAGKFGLDRKVRNDMTREEAINVLNDYDINFERHTAEEIAEAHEIAIKAIRTIPSEDEKIIKVRKGTLKARTGRYVIYDVEWLKTHFNTTEAKIYGQPNEDCISRKAVLESLHSCFTEGFNEDRWWNSTYVLDIINKAPSVTLQTKTEQETFEDCIRKSVIVHPKKGHWIGDKGATVYVNSEGNVTESVNCSECGEWLTGSDEYICGARYCPSCGIKMEEEKNEHKTESEEM